MSTSQMRRKLPSERQWYLKALMSHNNGIKTTLMSTLKNNPPTLFKILDPPQKNTSQIISLRDKARAFFYFTFCSLLRATIHFPLKNICVVLIIAKPQELQETARFTESAPLSAIEVIQVLLQEGFLLNQDNLIRLQPSLIQSLIKIHQSLIPFV